MSIPVTCPCCSFEFPLEAGLVEADGKRLAAVVGEMEPVLARAALSYLRLFKPAKQRALRLPRAVKLLREVAALVATGSVSRDDRSGQRYPATPALWAAGIDQMLASADQLSLPMEGHNYLRKVVYTLAETAAADQEAAREQTRPLHASHLAAGQRTGVMRELTTEEVLAKHQEMRTGKRHT